MQQTLISGQPGQIETRALAKGKLRVVCVCNRYALRGGEEEVFEAEAALLAGQGCHVLPVSIKTQPPVSPIEKLKIGMRTTWSGDWHRKMEKILAQERPDIVHVHNVFPVMSPAIFYACKSAGVPVVQTLHNYRLLCPGSLFYRNGKVCEECLGGGLHHGVQHGCYRNSRMQTAAVVMMLGAHRALGTWDSKIGGYIALTEFARRKFLEGGLPKERVFVKPNFLEPDPGLREGGGAGAVFVGHLGQQKGVSTLLEAWRLLPQEYRLRVIGEGPMLEDLLAMKRDWNLTGVSIEGRVPRSQSIAAIRGAQFLIFPSAWFECFPLTLIESFACGVPVVASNLGAMAEIVDSGRTGIFFQPGDAADLAEKIRWAFSHPDQLQAMSGECRNEYMAKYTATQNFNQLMKIYEAVMGRTRKEAA